MLNTIILTGRLARDPNLANAGTDQERLNLTVAFNERVGTEDRVAFIDVTMWGRGGSNVERFCSKGDEVHIKGRLTQRETGKDSSGQYDRPVFGIIADSFGGVTFGRKKGEGALASSDSSPAQPRAQAPADASEKVPF